MQYVRAREERAEYTVNSQSSVVTSTTMQGSPTQHPE